MYKYKSIKIRTHRSEYTIFIIKICTYLIHIRILGSTIKLGEIILSLRCKIVFINGCNYKKLQLYDCDGQVTLFLNILNYVKIENSK